MKKKSNVISLVFIFLLLGFSPLDGIKEKTKEIKQPENIQKYEKIDDARGILDKILEHIAKIDPELSFKDDQLLDSELGIPRFEISSFSEIKHFDKKDVVDGYIVRPVVDVENPKLLIVLEAADKKASVNLTQALKKVQSDQWAKYKDHDLWTRHLINESKNVRQGNFLIYAIWEDPVDIVKIFEQHVR